MEAMNWALMRAQDCFLTYSLLVPHLHSTYSPQGKMAAMGPTVLLPPAPGSTERRALTPAPPELLPAAAAARARARAQAVADALGLRGLVQVDCFVYNPSGELIVLDVKTAPLLRDGHPLFAQVRSGVRDGWEGVAAAHTPPRV